LIEAQTWTCSDGNFLRNYFDIKEIEVSVSLWFLMPAEAITSAGNGRVTRVLTLSMQGKVRLLMM
jgi:hypothetical protein